MLQVHETAFQTTRLSSEVGDPWSPGKLSEPDGPFIHR